ncbi:MAG: DUF2156 domain-containing protein [Burkholderiaceae bacterium]|nr:DUF2156 domain-containing protein [Burkholderiaceae bacterium]
MPIQLKPVTFEALDDLKRFLPAQGTGDCNLSVASLIARAQERETHYAIVNDTLVIRWRAAADEPFVWLLPIGCDCCPCVLEEMEFWSEKKGEPLRLFGNLTELVPAVEKALPYRTLSMTTKTAWWDYLYRRNDIESLLGRKLHGKRNFAKRFWTAYPHARFVSITKETLPLCREFLARWYARFEEMSDSMKDEARAIAMAFDHFEALALQGGLLMVGEKVCGFSYGARLTETMFAVHIEKADRDIVGAYPALASEMARSLPDEIEWLNREEDLGIEGLRKAKQDWSPAAMFEKGYVTLEPSKRA